MSEETHNGITYEELQERLSTGFYGELFYTTNDGENHQIGIYEMDTDWFVNNHMDEIVQAYLLHNLYEGKPLMSEDSKSALCNMNRHDLYKDIRSFTQEYFRETDVDFTIFHVSDGIQFFDDLPDEVEEELTDFPHDRMVEAIRDSQILNDDYDNHYEEALTSYSEDLLKEVASKLSNYNWYPLNHDDIDYSQLKNRECLLDVLHESATFDSHSRLLTTANPDLLLDNIDVFAEDDLDFQFWTNKLNDLVKDRDLRNDREFFSSINKGNYRGTNLIHFASDEIKSDKAFAMDWISKCHEPSSLCQFAKEVRDDLEVLKHCMDITLNKPNGEIIFNNQFPDMISTEMKEEFYAWRKSTQKLLATDFIKEKISERFANKLDSELAQNQSLWQNSYPMISKVDNMIMVQKLPKQLRQKFDGTIHIEPPFGASSLVSYASLIGS